MSTILKAQFATAVALLEEKVALQGRIAAWRKKAAGEGLAPSVLFKLAKESLLDEEERRKAAERIEIEELYRKNLLLARGKAFLKRRAAERVAAAPLQMAEG
jgi:hypothetical protein